jgi:hypothetical protein
VSLDRGSSSPEPLDEWLAQARWPELSAESTARLRQQWLALRGSRWQMLAPLSAAAIVLLAIGLAWLTQRKPPITPPPVANASSANASIRPALLAGRPPTVLESMMIRAAEDREKKKKSATKPAPQSTVIAVRNPPPRSSTTPPNPIRATPPAALPASRPPDRLDWIVNLLTSRNEPDVQRYLDLVADPVKRHDALAALARVASPPTERMLAALGDPRYERRVAAALVLGRIDGPVLTRRLIEMVAADQNRREALIALASSRGADARAFVRQAAQSSEFAGLARSTLAMNEIKQTEVQ